MKAFHTLVAGSSGGGKTTYLRELHDTYDGHSVYLTTKTNERKAARDPPRRIRRSSCTYPQDVHVAREWALKQPQSVQIIVDEADGALPDTEGKSGPESGNPLREGLHKDRDQAVKYVVCSQDPSDLYYPPLKQCRWFVYCGKPSAFHEGFFRYFRMPQEELETLDDWEYIVFDRGMNVQYRGKTKAKYA